MAWAGLASLAAVGAGLLSSGCANVGYLAQSVSGHLQLVSAARPVSQWLADESQPAGLRERLALSQRMRDFAVQELKLPDNRSYRAFADLQRPAAVWNVVAAPELSLSLKTWCFPMMGCVGYRGYFQREQADAFAQGLQQEPGLEVAVYGVPAYSTLGLTNWLGGDPLLNTFIRYPEGELARLIFHELTHQVVYVKDDTMFNESFATAVERLGAQRWLGTHGTPAARDEFVALERRREDFRALTMRYRERLDRLYRSDADAATKRAGKAALMAELRADYAALKAGAWGGYAGYDGWFARANNASFGLLAAYNELTPQFEALFEREGRDFERFYAAVRALARLPRDERRATLKQNLSPETH
ncbi:MAG: aminopeptidase [Burkholderiaceae bacterium]|nr:aminopeptidase [Burkholderiaceae bacterium]